MRAASLLLREAGLDEGGVLERPDQHALAQRGIAELRRALELAPQRAELRWRLGRTLALVHAAAPADAAARDALARDALACLLPLWDEQRWSGAGVEAAELALRCGTLAAELGDHVRAAELLEAAHARVSTEQRGRTSELLFASLVALDRREAAVQLASARASELADAAEQVGWLRRAAGLAEGARVVELLARAHELEPVHAISRLEHLELRTQVLAEIGAHFGIVLDDANLLRERLERSEGGP